MDCEGIGGTAQLAEAGCVFQGLPHFICDKSESIRYKLFMPLNKTMLLPLAAFIGSAAFLLWRYEAQSPVRQQATLFHETIQTVNTHRTETKAKAEAALRAGKSGAEPTEPSRAEIDLKEMAKLMGGMRSGAMPDMKAMLKLQKTVMDLSAEELSGLIAEAGDLDLPAEQRNGLVMMLIQSLGESDPKAAVMAAAEFKQKAAGSPQNMLAYPMRHAFSSWAKKDLTGALTWFDGAVAAGQFESTSLDDVNQDRSQMLSGVLRELWEKDPAAARQRLLALSEKERGAVLSNTDGFQKDETSQKQFSDLVRGVVPAKEQAGVLKQLAERVYGKDSLEGVTKLFSTIEATPEERKALATGVVESSIRQRTWGNGGEKPNLENTTKLRTWLAGEDTVDADTTLGKSLASTTNNGRGHYSPADALALVTELHTAEPSDRLLVSFLEQSKPKSNKEAWQSLAGKISDPAARAAALEKLAKP